MHLNEYNSPWTADLGDGTFRNPVLYADYADPDVIRVGADFYLISSSFSHLPGLPILHSRDLVNWRLLGHVLERIDLPGMDKPRHGEAVWAPSLRYYNSKFYVYFGTPDEGIFMCTADDPAGPWTTPYLVAEAKGWIDPCPFWDDDGKAYLIHAFAYSRCGIKDKLRLVEMSADGRELLGEGRIVFDGTGSHPTIEGPKLYKRSGWYYIFAPAGGVSTGWQTILRSRSIWGPYEDKVVLHQGNTNVNGPHQGGWVELDCGESWFLHFQERHAFGRILHLQPVRWVDDWPLMGEDTNGDGIGEPGERWHKPNVDGDAQPIAAPLASDDFPDGRIGLQWQWQSNPKPEWLGRAEPSGCLRLFARPFPPGVDTLYYAPQLLLQKLPAPRFVATTRLRFSPASLSDRAGLIVFGTVYTCLVASECPDGNGLRLSLIEGAPDGDERIERNLWSKGIPAALARKDAGSMFLRVMVEEDAVCRFSYSLDGRDYADAGYPVHAHPGKWVGAKVGIFSAAYGQDEGGFMDVDWFRIDDLPL